MSDPLFSIKVQGEVPSKKNRYKIGNGRMYQDHGVKDWMEDCGWQIKAMKMSKQASPVSCDIRVEIDFYIRRDKDIDNMLNSVFDLVQNFSLIVNDKQIRSLRADKYLRPKEVPYFSLSAFSV